MLFDRMFQSFLKNCRDARYYPCATFFIFAGLLSMTAGIMLGGNVEDQHVIKHSHKHEHIHKSGGVDDDTSDDISVSPGENGNHFGNSIFNGGFALIMIAGVFLLLGITSLCMGRKCGNIPRMIANDTPGTEVIITIKDMDELLENDGELIFIVPTDFFKLTL